MLDARKLARVVTNRTRMRQGRTRTVTLVYLRPEGSAYLTAEVVWRAEPYAEPSVRAAPIGGEPPAVRVELAPEVDPRLVSFVADTATATAEGVAAVPCYEIATYRAAGLSQNRWLAQLRRLR